MDIERYKLEDDYLRELLEEEQRTLKLHEHDIQRFIKYSKAHGLSITHDSISSPRTIGVVANQADILANVLPGLTADKEGLYSWVDINSHLSNKNRNGFFYHENFMVMFHPFFRRNFIDEAHYAPGIVNAFIYEGQKKNQLLSVALDVNRLRINVDDTYYAESDTWFGPPFHKDIASISDGPVKLAPPQGFSNSLYERWFSSTRFLNILWTSHKNIREFQLEEVKDESIMVYYQGTAYHPIRYIHAEFDLEHGNFRHLDGAVHLYTDHEYNIRINGNLNINVENFRSKIKPFSVKLFKINGQIPSGQFISYCSLFLPHDPLIHEYFTGELPEYCAKAVRYYQSKGEG